MRGFRFLFFAGCALGLSASVAGCRSENAQSQAPVAESSAPAQTTAPPPSPLEATILPPPAVPPGGEEKVAFATPTRKEHVLNVGYSVLGMAFELRVNGVLIAGEETPDSPSGAARVEQYIKPGKNTFDVILEQARDENSEATIRFQRFLEPEKGKDVKSENLVVLEYKAGQPLISKRYVFEAESPYKLWTEGERIELDDDAARGIVQASLEVHAALAGKDKAALNKHLRYRATEFGIMMGEGPKKSIESQAGFVDMILGVKEFEVQPLESKDLQLQLVGDGYMVEVTRKGEPFLMVGKHGPGFDAYFGRINGEYVLVR